VDRLLQAKFIRPCRYTEWVSNIVQVEKKNIGKIRICVDFRNLNRATLKDEYPMPVIEALINNASGNRMISFFWMVTPVTTRFLWLKTIFTK
jgi:hypothetical protein